MNCPSHTRTRTVTPRVIAASAFPVPDQTMTVMVVPRTRPRRKRCEVRLVIP